MQSPTLEVGSVLLGCPELSGEALLWLAVIERAVRDLDEHSKKDSHTSRRLCAEIEHWASSRNDHPSSLKWICDNIFPESLGFFEKVKKRLKMSKNASIGAVTYVQIWAGSYEAYAFSTSAWRLSDKLSPASTEYAAIPANQVVPLPMGKPTFARSESGTITIQVVE